MEATLVQITGVTPAYDEVKKQITSDTTLTV